MKGVIRYIRRRHNNCSLIDGNGVERLFKRDAFVVPNDMTVEDKFGAHDAVSFDLDGNTVSNVTLDKKHSEGTVFSW